MSKKPGMNEKTKNLLLWILISTIMASVFSNFGPRHPESLQLNYSELIKQISQQEIKSVNIQEQNITGETTSGQKFVSFMPMRHDQELLNELIKHDVQVKGQPPEKHSFFLSMLLNWFPMLLLIGIYVFYMRQMQGGAGGKGPLSFIGNKAKVGSKTKVKFKDVAGIPEAIQEIQEVVEFLKTPGKFTKIGGKIPCGCLLVGPPGTGKTLLAKAVAGEANVPFFSISGSDFVEMFVGVGASRVRNMFETAKKQSPCIIFIDEIDAVGRHRGSGMGGGHDEREQTLNQLLVEMDGFEGKETVIVMAATNRPDVLDPALLRPGRFDRQLHIPLPDIMGRLDILNVYLKKIIAGKDVNAERLAQGTPGFSGADLANLVNEGALLAASKSENKVSMACLEAAKDKIMMGTERKSMAMSDDEKRTTAYHEAGHAIVGLLSEDHDPVYKVSIIPRGRALGVTMFLPETDKLSLSRTAAISKLCSLFGGRIAEEIILGPDHITTGASNDIEKATELARNFITKWGLNKKLGPINYAGNENSYIGHGSKSDISDDTAAIIDSEMRQLIDETYKKAEKLLRDNIDLLHDMANALIKYETIEKEQIEDIMAKKEIRPPKSWKKTRSKKKSSVDVISKKTLLKDGDI